MAAYSNTTLATDNQRQKQQQNNIDEQVCAVYGRCQWNLLLAVKAEWTEFLAASI